MDNQTAPSSSPDPVASATGVSSEYGHPHPPRTGGRRLRFAVGAAAAGGAMLASSVAIPVTWALAGTDAVAVTAGTVSTGGEDAAVSEIVPDSLPDLLPGALPGSGSASSSTGVDATGQQAQGVVLIESTTAGGAGAGTGIVLTEDGLVISNYHVVEDAAELTVTVATTGETFTAEVVGFDETADVALLELADASGLTVAALDDDADDGEVGDAVTAVGNAQGQGYLSAVEGEVTAVDQSITTSDGYGLPGETERLTGLTETTAAAVPGYSGGPTLDAEGEVLGLTTAASTSGAAESFAIPIEDVLDVIDRIRAGDESGTVQVGPSAYLGVSVTETTSGVGVAEVEAGTPAADAGLAAGAVITAVDGTAVARVEELTGLLARHEPGDRVALTWTTRAGEQRTATVTLAASPYA